MSKLNYFVEEEEKTKMILNLFLEMTKEMISFHLIGKKNLQRKEN